MSRFSFYKAILMIKSSFCSCKDTINSILPTSMSNSKFDKFTSKEKVTYVLDKASASILTEVQTSKYNKIDLLRILKILLETKS